MPEKKEINQETIPSVGLIIVTRQSKDSPFVVVLRRRSELRFDKKPWGRESFPGAYQATVHSKLRWKESHTETLLRKAREQLGESFFNIAKLDEREMCPLFYDQKRMVKTYGLAVRPCCIDHIRLSQTSSGIKILQVDEVHRIRELKPEDRNTIICNSDDIAMFPDEITAIRRMVNNTQLLAFLQRI